MSTNHPKEKEWIAPKTHPHKFPDKITLITFPNIRIQNIYPYKKNFLSIVTKRKFQKGENFKKFTIKE